MTFTQFKSLDSEERYKTWMAKSVKVASYHQYGLVHVLYQMDDFYIEMCILKAFLLRVNVVAFSDGYRLNPYLQRIDISELII
jgi:uncharacterized membrane protein